MINLYYQNRNLTVRLLESVILYLLDLIDERMSVNQKQQSSEAVLLLLDSALNYMNDDLPKEIREPLERIFMKTIYDVTRKDINNIMKDVRAFKEMLKIIE